MCDYYVCIHSSPALSVSEMHYSFNSSHNYVSFCVSQLELLSTCPFVAKKQNQDLYGI